MLIYWLLGIPCGVLAWRLGIVAKWYWDNDFPGDHGDLWCAVWAVAAILWGIVALLFGIAGILTLGRFLA